MLATHPGYDVSVTVTPKKLTVTNVKVNDKVYDGTNKTVFGNTGKLSGVVAGDVVEIGGIEGYYPNSQIGRNKSVVIKKEISGIFVQCLQGVRCAVAALAPRQSRFLGVLRDF